MGHKELRKLTNNLLQLKVGCQNFISSVENLKSDPSIWENLDDEFKNRCILTLAKMKEFNKIDWDEVQEVCSRLSTKKITKP